MPVLTQSVKPFRWNVSPGLIGPNRLWAWRGLVLLAPFWEGTPAVGQTDVGPFDYVGRKMAMHYVQGAWVSTTRGLAPTFNGNADSRVSFADRTDLKISGSITLEVLARIDTIATAGLLSKINSSGVGGYGLWLRSNGTWEIIVDNPTDTFSRANGDSLSTGIWYHLVGVYDGVNLITYRDGVLKVTVAYTSGIATSTNPLVIGAIQTDFPFTGQIALARVYNRALTQSEIKRLAIDPFGPFRMARKAGVLEVAVAAGYYYRLYGSGRHRP